MTQRETTGTTDHGRSAEQSPQRRARRRGSKAVRGSLAAGAVFVGVMVPTPAMAAGCTDTETRNNMTCQTDPAVSKCVLGVSTAGALGAIAGGPVGFLVGVVGAGATCAINTIG